MAGLLFATSPADPMTYVAVAVTLGAVAFCACLVPACRAARLNPVTTLRQD